MARPRGPARGSHSVEAGYEGRFDLAGWHLIGAVYRQKRTLRRATPTLIDLGMGRGRDLIYFSRRGFLGSGVDISTERIEKARRRAARLALRIRTRRADLRTYRWVRPFDVVFSSSFVNYLPTAIRRRRFREFQAGTSPGGIHAINALVPTVPATEAPDLEPGMRLFRRGELRRYYPDWELNETATLEWPCLATGVAHRHAWDFVVARRPA